MKGRSFQRNKVLLQKPTILDRTILFSGECASHCHSLRLVHLVLPQNCHNDCNITPSCRETQMFPQGNSHWTLTSEDQWFSQIWSNSATLRSCRGSYWEYMRRFREKQNSRPMGQFNMQRQEPMVLTVEQKQLRQNVAPVQTAASLAPAVATILLTPSPLFCLLGSWLAMRCTLAPAEEGKEWKTSSWILWIF